MKYVPQTHHHSQLIDGFPYIWPLPQSFSNGTVIAAVDAAAFAFKSNVSSVDLSYAFARYNTTIFPHTVASAGPSAISGVMVNVCNADKMDKPSFIWVGWQRVRAAAALCRRVVHA